MAFVKIACTRPQWSNRIGRLSLLQHLGKVNSEKREQGRGAPPHMRRNVLLVLRLEVNLGVPDSFLSSALILIFANGCQYRKRVNALLWRSVVHRNASNADSERPINASFYWYRYHVIHHHAAATSEGDSRMMLRRNGVVVNRLRLSCFMDV